MKEGNIAVMKRTSDEGDLVLNHSFSHPGMSGLNRSRIDMQLNRTLEQIEAITGNYPILFRPPYGSINPLVVETANDCNMSKQCV